MVLDVINRLLVPVGGLKELFVFYFGDVLDPDLVILLNQFEVQLQFQFKLLVKVLHVGDLLTHTFIQMPLRPRNDGVCDLTIVVDLVLNVLSQMNLRLISDVIEQLRYLLLPLLIHEADVSSRCAFL